LPPVPGASKVFLALDPDKDGTVDAKELAGRLDTAGLNAVDSDNDGTLDSKEYAKLVEAKFTAANPDGDGTIDDKELSSSAGGALLKLIH
jgi:Ca2+-binding EF-hand superfamily protein